MIQKNNPAEKKRAAFDMFIRLREGIPSQFNDQKRTWCFRGDKFTDVPREMLQSLLNLLKRRIHHYGLVEIYDNRRPMDSDDRLILKILVDRDGNLTFEKNNLAKYIREMLPRYPLPTWLK